MLRNANATSVPHMFKKLKTRQLRARKVAEC